MIYQGYNIPMVLILKTDISEAESVHVQLTHDDGPVLKEWGMDDVSITSVSTGGCAVICPIKQAESATWKHGKAWIDCSCTG